MFAISTIGIFIHVNTGTTVHVLPVSCENFEYSELFGRPNSNIASVASMQRVECKN